MRRLQLNLNYWVTEVGTDKKHFENKFEKIGSVDPYNKKRYSLEVKLYTLG